MGQDLKKGIRSPYMIVDFGRPVFGFPKVHLSGPAGGVVEMSYAVDLINGRPMTILGGIQYGDHYSMKQGPQTWQVFEYKSFRYLMVVFRNVDASVSVDAITVVEYRYPARRKGAFQCSDTALTRLWKSCIDTCTFTWKIHSFATRCARGCLGRVMVPTAYMEFMPALGISI